MGFVMLLLIPIALSILLNGWWRNSFYASGVAGILTLGLLGGFNAEGYFVLYEFILLTTTTFLIGLGFALARIDRRDLLSAALVSLTATALMGTFIVPMLFTHIGMQLLTFLGGSAGMWALSWRVNCTTKRREIGMVHGNKPCKSTSRRDAAAIASTESPGGLKGDVVPESEAKSGFGGRIRWCFALLGMPVVASGTFACVYAHLYGFYDAFGKPIGAAQVVSAMSGGTLFPAIEVASVVAAISEDGRVDVLGSMSQKALPGGFSLTDSGTFYAIAED